MDPAYPDLGIGPSSSKLLISVSNCCQVHSNLARHPRTGELHLLFRAARRGAEGVGDGVGMLD